MQQRDIYLDKILELEENGDFVLAVALFDEAMKRMPAEEAFFLYERGKFQFRNANYQEALTDFIYAYQISNDPEIYELVLEAYLYPNQENLILQYQENLKLLENYPHYKNEYPQEELHFYPIFQSDEMVACVDTQNRTFAIDHRKEIKFYPEHDTCYMMFNELWSEDIIKCEEKSRLTEPFMDMNIPMYLVFDKLYWLLFLQLQDIKVFIEVERIIFLVGEEVFREYFSDTQVIMPNRLQCEDYTNYMKALSEIAFIRKIHYDEGQKKIRQYYSENILAINEHIKSGNPKILFLTSRFTTVLQYHTRDCMEATKRLGCETELLIESDGLRRITNFYTVERLVEFQPDIVFCLDHFRYEHPEIPPEIVWITWVQDPMPHIMDKATPGKLTDRDFVMNHFITWDKISNVGYPKERMIEAPIPANNHIYKPYEISEEERKEYESDICMVCHRGDTEYFIEEYVQKIGENIKDEKLSNMIRSMLYDYAELVHSEEFVIYTQAELKVFFEEYFKQIHKVKVNEDLLECLADELLIPLNENAYRQALADWLIEAGYTNLKLWGNGWIKSPKYKDYAMGPAQNGEVLSKILQCSKIVIGNNVFATGAARVWETMLSGTLYISNRPPTEVDAVSIFKLLKEGEDVVVFHNRKELIEKVQYYLTHEEERQQIIDRGREKALQNRTFDALMKHVIEFIQNTIEKQEKL